jgi:coproporphyrinogen III oxidase
MRPARLCALAMLALDDQQQATRDWFESLRDRICAAFEAIEREAGSDAAFVYSPWEREDAGGEAGGGGVRGLMKGKVFEKVGVNVSTVGGAFSPEFASQIHGAEDDPSFFATGISLVAHMANPHVPAVHMNTRFLTTTKRWFGGGADLNPAIPYAADTEAFHARFRAACAAHDPTFYPKFSKWAEDYFWLPHRGLARGVGGIFYDHLEDHFDEHFAFTREVGEAFLDIFPAIVRKRMATPFNEADMDRLLEFRGRYVEFNMLYDRGTLFGLKTGGNIDAILMSLPPLARWS